MATQARGKNNKRIVKSVHYKKLVPTGCTGPGSQIHQVKLCALTHNQVTVITLHALTCYWAGDIWATMTEFRVTSDVFPVVLEIAPESGKTTSDSEPCSLRNLLHEFEEEGIVDVKIQNHTLEQPGADEGSTMQTRHAKPRSRHVECLW